MAFDNLMVFTGNANPKLAQRVAKHLNIQLGKATVSKFSDGEVMVELLENVRGKDVFVLQSTCAPTNDTLMELMIMVDALRRSSAARITAAIPYFGYARQDRRPRSARVAISKAKVGCRHVLTVAGVNRVLTMDLHADQIQGFFDMPVDNVYATPILLGDLWKHGYKNLVVVSPDVGGVVRARAIAKRLESDLAIIDKRRPRPNVATVMNIIGDVNGRTCVIMDDMAQMGRHAVRGGAGIEGARRRAGDRVLHAQAFRSGGEPHRELGDRRAGRVRHDPVEARGRGLQEDPPDQRGGVAGGDDAQDL